MRGALAATGAEPRLHICLCACFVVLSFIHTAFVESRVSVCLIVVEALSHVALSRVARVEQVC